MTKALFTIVMKLSGVDVKVWMRLTEDFSMSVVWKLPKVFMRAKLVASTLASGGRSIRREEEQHGTG